MNEEDPTNRPTKTPKDARHIPSPISRKALDSDVEGELRGRTLRAYLYILRNSKPIGVRELQRALGLSSPSVAYHHIDKLVKLGLIEKNEYAEYVIAKSININVLQAFTQIGRMLIPRFIFYAMFFTTLLLGYVVLFQGNSNLYALAFGVFSCAFAWYETIRTWRKRPF